MMKNGNISDAIYVWLHSVFLVIAKLLKTHDKIKQDYLYQGEALIVPTAF